MSVREGEIHPLPDLSVHPARRQPAYCKAENRTCILGNGFFEVRINFEQRHRQTAELLNKLTGESISLEFRPFRAWLDDGELSGADAQLQGIEARGAAEVASVTTLLSYSWFDVESSYVVRRGDHFLQKRLLLRNFRREGYLQRFSLFTHHISPDYQLVSHQGGMYYPIVFLRSKKSGLFFCLDFPCYFSTVDDSYFTFDYYPSARLVPGHSFQTLTAHLGVCSLLGRGRANPYHDSGTALDVGEEIAFRDYILRNRPPAQIPFLELKGSEPGTDGPSDLEILEQCRWLGVQHVLLPRMLAAVDAYPSLEVVKERMRKANIKSKFVWSRGAAENVRWLTLDLREGAEVPASTAYFAVDAFREYLLEHHLAVMERHGFKDVEVSGAPVVPYCGERPDRPDEMEVRGLLHQAFQSLVDVVAALTENFGHVSCGTTYSCYGAGLTHLFGSASFMADDHPLAIPDIHPGRLYADMNRLYFRRSHSLLLPKSFLINSVGFPHAAQQRPAPYPGATTYPWHLYFDRKGWRYALMSAIATGLRHRFHPLPMDLSDEDKAFAKKWLRWERDHLAELREVEELLDEPGLGTVDGYSYANSHNAIIFLFSNSYDPQEVRLRLHLSRDAEYLVRELYPREYNYCGPNEGCFRKDGDVVLTLAPREVRVIEAVRRSPAAGKRKRPEIFGAPGHDSNGSVVLQGGPGERCTVGIRAKGQFIRREIQFPGEPAPEHIRDWTCVVRGLEEGKDKLPAGRFSGNPPESLQGPTRDVWLAAQLKLPADVVDRVDRSPFQLTHPCWTYLKRLFFVVRFEPTPAFDPIRMSSDVEGIPECYWNEQAMKCGIDLAPLNIGLKAWINGKQCVVYPALACWKRLTPNPNPVVAYFFEAGSKLRVGEENSIVLYARHFYPDAFRGIVIEHLPALTVEKVIDLP